MDFCHRHTQTGQPSKQSVDGCGEPAVFRFCNVGVSPDLSRDLIKEAFSTRRKGSKFICVGLRSGIVGRAWLGESLRWDSTRFTGSEVT